MERGTVSGIRNLQINRLKMGNPIFDKPGFLDGMEWDNEKKYFYNRKGRENLNMETQKLRPLAIDKLRIFMQYPYEHYYFDNRVAVLEGKVKNINPSDFKIGCDGWTFEITSDHTITVELRLLQKITDQDAIEVAKLCHSGYSHKDDYILIREGKDVIENYLNRQSNIYGLDWLKVFDYLRSKSYALPYKNWSVEDLVEFGIYKLID